MMQQLGITKLRPGRNDDAKASNADNYDETIANPYPHLLDILKSASGDPIVTKEQWQNSRRPEIVELQSRSGLPLPGFVKTLNRRISGNAEFALIGLLDFLRTDPLRTLCLCGLGKRDGPY